MLNYQIIVEDLQEKDEYAVDKLAMYYELLMLSNPTAYSNEDISGIVDYLHDIFYDTDETDFRYPGFAVAAVRIFDYDLSALLTSIRENKEELKEQILKEYKSLC